MKPRRMTLDLLRQKYRGALATAAACTPPLDLRASLTVVFIDEHGEETDISESHFLSDAQCLPGRYSVAIAGPSGVAFSGEATLSDPAGLPSSGGFGFDPKRETSSFISALMLEGRNQITHTGDELRKVQDRNRELEAFSLQLMKRVNDLEMGRGNTGGADTQRELLQVLQHMACKWLGIGGAAWKPETVMHALAILGIVQRSPAVQAAIRSEGGAEPLRLLVEAA